ncbi:alpha/beta fold hydrolase [Amycolatopsis sp. NPDC051061]|uniref:alpha/beta fold hydrolase n=1 Tax=Amycolatopsis sp. NPDC051061 TaxID=3155042 RepID=UPI00344AD94F
MIVPEALRYEIGPAARIAARVAGAGPAVLLLHGVGTASASFRAQFDGLEDAFELIAWDAFGYGGSSEPPPSAGLDDYVDAAVALLDVREVRDAHVVGVSWGGVVATRLALRQPRRVRTLALISSTSGRKDKDAVRDGFPARIASLEQEGVRAWAEARVHRQVSPTASAELRREIVETAVGSVRLPGFAAALGTLADTDHRARLGEVRAPAVVLAGERDSVTGAAESRVLAAGIPGAELVLVPGGGHLLNQEAPGVVNEVLRRHWQAHDGREGDEE